MSGVSFLQKAKDRLGFVPSDLDSTFKSTVEWYDHLFLHDDHEREEMIARLLQNIVPPNKKNQVSPIFKPFDTFKFKNQKDPILSIRTNQVESRHSGLGFH